MLYGHSLESTVTELLTLQRVTDDARRQLGIADFVLRLAGNPETHWDAVYDLYTDDELGTWLSPDHWSRLLDLACSTDEVTYDSRLLFEVLRTAEDERFKIILGAKQPYGWQQEGPDYELMARSPRGLYD